MIDEPTNEQRALRIDALFSAYNEITNGADDTLSDYLDLACILADYLDLACILADMRHWCDIHDVDFYAALDLSYQHYLEERADATPA